MTLAYNEPKYQIEAPDFRCQACEKEIACEASYFSAVFFLEEAFRRRNYCAACWKPGTDGVFAFWRTRRPALPSDHPKRVRFDTALVLEFFRRLGDEPSGEGPSIEERDQLRFVLSLLLVRKKILNFGSSYQENGAEVLKMAEKADPARIHWVKNPELSDSQLERVKDRIGELLQMQI
jgi:hypothetical protein